METDHERHACLLKEAIGLEIGTLSGVFAAALPGKRRVEHFTLGQSPETQTLLRAVGALGGRAKLLTNGKLSVKPAKKTPRLAVAVCPFAGETLFWFLSGLAAGVSATVAVLRVEPDISKRASLGAYLATGEICVLLGAGSSGYVFSCAVKPDRIEISPLTPPAFTAGMMVGAAFSPRESVFLFRDCAPAPAHFTAAAHIRARGGRADELPDGFRISAGFTGSAGAGPPPPSQA